MDLPANGPFLESRHTMRVTSILWRSAFAAVVFSQGCTESTGPGAPAGIASNSAVSLTGTAGAPVSPSPSVLVTDDRGRPVAGVAVTFAIGIGGGTLSAPGATTDSAGIATIRTWTLGTASGPNTVIASVPGLQSITFTALGNPGAPASLEKVSGDNQTTILGTLVPSLLSVRVRDANGNPVPGVSVSFAPTDLQSVVTGATQITNEAGIATLGSWQVAARAGPFALDAVAGALKVTFRATAAFGPATSISMLSGNNQTGRTGFDLNRYLVVTVRDSNGNRRPQSQVVFAVTGGGGRLINAVQTTNLDGEAGLSEWILGPPGPQTVTATLSGGGPSVVFSAIATAPVPDGPAFDLQDPSLDTSAGTSNRQEPPIYDLLSARGDFVRDTLVISLTFNVPITRVAPVNSGGLRFGISLDLDQDGQPDYGVGGEVNTTATAQLGGRGFFTTIPASYLGNTVTVRIPMPRLEGDDGNLSLRVRAESADGVEDRFPNAGSVVITRPAGISANRLR